MSSASLGRGLHAAPLRDRQVLLAPGVGVDLALVKPPEQFLVQLVLAGKLCGRDRAQRLEHGDVAGVLLFERCRRDVRPAIVETVIAQVGRLQRVLAQPALPFGFEQGMQFGFGTVGRGSRGVCRGRAAGDKLRGGGRSGSGLRVASGAALGRIGGWGCSGSRPELTSGSAVRRAGRTPCARVTSSHPSQGPSGESGKGHSCFAVGQRIPRKENVPVPSAEGATRPETLRQRNGGA